MSPVGDKRDWAGQHAMAWVIDDAPVPVELAWTLIVIARRCDENGKGSFQSMPTLAAKTGKSEDQVRRDVAKLLELKLIKLGDQTLPEQRGVPAGKRPVVYDVMMHLRGPKPSRESKNKSGKRKATETPRMDATPGMDARGGMEAPSTPGMHAVPTPGMDATQTTPMNNPVEKSAAHLSPPPSDEPSTGSATPEPRERRQRLTSAERTRVVAVRLLTEVRSYKLAEAEYLIDALTERYGIYSAAWWTTAQENGTLDDRIEEVKDEYLAEHAARRAEAQEAAA